MFETQIEITNDAGVYLLIQRLMPFLSALEAFSVFGLRLSEGGGLKDGWPVAGEF